MPQFFMLLISFFSSFAMAAQVELQFKATNPEQFKYEIIDEGMGLMITEPKNSRKTKIPLKQTISDATKVSLVPGKGNSVLKGPVEMLLVVISKGNILQDVQLYVPIQPEQAIKASQTTALCSLENSGDFSWEKPSELKDKIRVFQNQTKFEVQLKVGTLPKNSENLKDITRSWVKCFEF